MLTEVFELDVAMEDVPEPDVDRLVELMPLEGGTVAIGAETLWVGPEFGIDMEIVGGSKAFKLGASCTGGNSIFGTAGRALNFAVAGDIRTVRNE